MATRGRSLGFKVRILRVRGFSSCPGLKVLHNGHTGQKSQAGDQVAMPRNLIIIMATIVMLTVLGEMD